METQNKISARRLLWLGLTFLPVVLLAWVLTSPSRSAQAAPEITFTQLTWDEIGLDISDTGANVGPTIYPVGVRVCNNSTETALNVRVNFSLLATNGDTDGFFNLNNASSITYASLQRCVDTYFYVSLNVSTAAIGAQRNYQFEVVGNNLAAQYHTGTLRINDLVHRNQTGDTIDSGTISGPSEVTLTQSTVRYVVTSIGLPTSHQVQNYIYFPTNIFRIQSVESSYTDDGVRNSPYLNVCDWSKADHACQNNNSIGGRVTYTYTVDILATSPQTVTIYPVVYNYNNDNNTYGYRIGAARVISIRTTTSNTTATPTPQPGPRIRIVASPSSVRISDEITFTVSISNTGATSMTDAAVQINFPKSFWLRRIETRKGEFTKSLFRQGIGFVQFDELAKGESATMFMRGEVADDAQIRAHVVEGNLTGMYNGTIQTYPVSTTFTVTGLPSSAPSGGSGLPNSGYAPLHTSASGTAGLFLPGLLMGGLLTLLAVATLALSLRARRQGSEWASWLTRTGIVLLVAGMAFNFSAVALSRDSQGSSQIARWIDPSRDSGERAPILPNFRATGEAWVIDPTWATNDHPAQNPEVEGTPVPSPTYPHQPTQPVDNSPDTSAITRIQVPRIQVDTSVLFIPQHGTEWVDIRVIQKEIGWLGGSSRPGMGSNTALTGHVTLANGKVGPFYSLNELIVGDVVYLFTEKNRYSYTVRESKIVHQDDTTVLNPTAGSQITLITCADWDEELETFVNRLIVFADLKEVKPISQLIASQ